MHVGLPLSVEIDRNTVFMSHERVLGGRVAATSPSQGSSESGWFYDFAWRVNRLG
jgi:hypothetical protein